MRSISTPGKVEQWTQLLTFAQSSRFSLTLLSSPPPPQVCLPENGSRVNRARIERDAAGWLLSMQEQYDICSGDVGPDRRYTGDELTSLNIFGFRPSHLAIFAAQYDAWLQALLAEPAGPPPPGKKDRYIFLSAIECARAVDSRRP